VLLRITIAAALLLRNCAERDTGMRLGGCPLRTAHSPRFIAGVAVIRQVEHPVQSRVSRLPLIETRRNRLHHPLWLAMERPDRFRSGLFFGLR
jgi:hypothetical protein